MRQPGTGAATRRARLEQYIADQGWELVGIYEDVGPNARPRNQPALKQIVEGEPAELDKLVVVGINSFGRRVRRTLEVIHGLQARGVDLVSIEEEFDAGAESGRAAIAVIGRIAQWEWGAHQQWTGGWLPDNLRKPGFAPRTIIDVGVAMGTKNLYQAFPDARRVLIEPLEEFEPYLSSLVENGGEYHLCAAGGSAGTLTIDVDYANLMMSSALDMPERPIEHAGQVEGRTVPMTTLDALLEEHRWEPPFGLKIDAEGYDHEVVAGAKRLLEDTQFVIAEVNVTKRFEASHTFAEFIALMASLGFELCDILDGQKRWQTRELAYVDALFRRPLERGSR